MMKIAFVAAAALLAASAFAQSSVTTSTGASVSSASGLTVTPGMPTAAVETHRLLPGGAMVQRSSTTVLGGPSADAVATRTQVSTYWANVPANAPARHDFRRWQALK
jgi:hypothetical protein